MVKLSFIVPVYNVEKYLRKCVESLIRQDYSDYEIILVDDGSTDGSGELCDEILRANDEMSRADALNEPLSLNDDTGVRCKVYGVKIRVIHQANGGLSAARNAGLKVAKGEYVCFVDSDDYWEENVLGGLMAQTERENLDVLRFNYQNVRVADSQESRVKSQEQVYEVFQPNKDPKRDVDYSEEVTDGETFLNERLGPACYAVMFIVRRTILIDDRCIDNRSTSIEDRRLKKDDCLFKEGIYFEDTEWTPRMLLIAKRVASTPMVVYNYLWRTGSITLPTDPKKREKVIRDKIALLRGFKEQSKLVKDSKWFTWMTSFMAMSILAMLAALPPKERGYYLKELKELQIYPLSTMKAHGIYKRKIQLANISPKLYCKLMSLRH